MAQKPHPCCNVDTNLLVEEAPRKINGQVRGIPLTGTLVVRKCAVCGARHHEVSADPGHFGLKGSGA